MDSAASSPPEKPALVPAESKPHYWIMKQGRDAWNRWARKAFVGNDRIAQVRTQLEGMIYGGTQTQAAEEKEKRLKAWDEFAALEPLEKTDADYQEILEKIQEHCNDARTRELPHPQQNINFSNTEWVNNAEKNADKFIGYIFPSFIHCKSSKFSDYINFTNSMFLQGADFTSTSFCKGVTFASNTFYHAIIFSSTTFSAHSYFTSATFSHVVRFKKAIFEETQCFKNTVFERNADFTKADFKATARFKYAQFLCKELEEHTTDEDGDVSPSFIGASFSKIANFRRATFASPPHFEGAKADAIIFTREGFTNHDNKDLTLAAQAWAALMRLMDHTHNLPMRQEFHKKLLEVEKPPLHILYCLLGSGRNPWYPLYVWGYSLVLFFIIYCKLFLVFSPYHPTDILAYSAKLTMLDSAPFMAHDSKSILKPLNYTSTEAQDMNPSPRRMTGSGVIEPDAVMQRHDSHPETKPHKASLSTAGVICFTFARIIHSAISVVSLFFIGLALRNRFRMKASSS
jgi:uncharacterized protein YjbI with pentapeptide repeats